MVGRLKEWSGGRVVGRLSERSGGRVVVGRLRERSARLARLRLGWVRRHRSACLTRLF